MGLGSFFKKLQNKIDSIDDSIKDYDKRSSNQDLKNDSPINSDNVDDIISKYGIKEYNKGYYSELIKSKDVMETYDNYGHWGVLIQLKLYSHFVSLDCVNDYFTTGGYPQSYLDLLENSDLDYKMEGINSGVNYKGDPRDPYDKYTFSDLNRFLSDTKLRESIDVSLNFEGFLEKQDEYINENLFKSMKSGFPTEINDSNTYSSSLGGKYGNYVGYNDDKSKSVEKLFCYLLNLKKIDELKELSKEIVGFNYMYLITPLSYMFLNVSFVDKSLKYDYHNFFGYCGSKINKPGYHNTRGIDGTEFEKLSLWNQEIYMDTYNICLKKFIPHFNEKILENINVDGTIFKLKKESFELLKDDKEKSLHMSQIFNHLMDSTNNINGYFKEFIKNIKSNSLYQGGYINVGLENYLYFEYINSKIFETRVIINVTGLMIETIKNNDEFSYNELYMMIEKFKIFDKTIEKESLSTLKDISKELRNINVTLVQINSSILNGFNTVVKQLDGINNKMWYNNLLTTINTYQIHRISNKL